MRRSGEPAPPVIDRLVEPSEAALLEQWPHLERQLEAAVAFAAALERARRAGGSSDDAYRWLQQSLRELDQYSRAIRWVLTVTENDEP